MTDRSLNIFVGANGTSYIEKHMMGAESTLLAIQTKVFLLLFVLRYVFVTLNFSLFMSSKRTFYKKKPKKVAW